MQLVCRFVKGHRFLLCHFGLLAWKTLEFLIVVIILPKRLTLPLRCLTHPLTLLFEIFCIILFLNTLFHLWLKLWNRFFNIGILKALLYNRLFNHRISNTFSHKWLFYFRIRNTFLYLLGNATLYLELLLQVLVYWLLDILVISRLTRRLVDFFVNLVISRQLLPWYSIRCCWFLFDLLIK
jgi:hypothetical protein